MGTALELGARAEVYRLLSRAFHTPHDSFLGPDFLDPLKSALGLPSLSTCADEVESMRRYLLSLPSTLDLAVEYTRLFRGPVRAQAYPYESMYTEGGVMGKAALEVLKQYGKAGVSLSEDFKDLPDHIAAELEFMHYLCSQELEARLGHDEPGAGHLAHLGCAFVKDHLAQWVPPFADRVAEHATTPFYLALARLTKAFICWEAGCSVVTG